MLLYLLLTWFFENGPGTSPYAVHASVFRRLKGLKPFRNQGAKTGIQTAALLELETRCCLFLVPSFDTRWPVLLQHPSPYQQEPNQKTVNAKYAMQRRKRPTWWEGGSGRYALLFGQGNKHGEFDDGSTCLSGRKASIKVSNRPPPGLCIWGKRWDLGTWSWVCGRGVMVQQHGKKCVATLESAFDSEGSGF